MLYLNTTTIFYRRSYKPNLTLTSVVFELSEVDHEKYPDVNLTLTSVVFEFVYWNLNHDQIIYLTLTSVVFEFN